MEWLRNRILNQRTDDSYNPVLHIDVYGTIGAAFGNNNYKAMADYIAKLEELAKEYEGQIVIYKVDVDAEVELARLFKVRSIPTLVYIPTEGLPVVEMGGKGKGELKQKLDALK